MSFSTTIVFYVLIGISVSFALILSNRRASPIHRFFHMAASVVFWPIYLPVLLHRKETNERRVYPGDVMETGLSPQSGPRHGQSSVDGDPMEQAIVHVEEELDAALRCLDGWAEDFLLPESDRFSELRTAWRLQASRIRDLDELLRQPAFDEDIAAKDGESCDSQEPVSLPNDRMRASQRSRRENVERLRGIRQQMHRDLMGTLAWVRELVTLIHLAKYTGAPASRAEELVAQIAAAVEGLSQIANWQQHSESAK